MAPLIPAPRLRTVVASVCEAIGASPDDARLVASSLVAANLCGYDSHGVYRLGQYVEWWRRGLLLPAARPSVVGGRGFAVQVDGGFTFGQVVAAFAADTAVRTASSLGIAAVTARRSNHVGRLADWVDRVRAAGLVGVAMANDAGSGQVVAPHGGIDGRLSTNPIAVGVPGGSGPGLLFDFSTSAAASGKVRQLLLRGEPAPEGWLQDAAGRPTTDPTTLFGTPPGTLLPAGGHHGYALSLLVEVLAGVLSGAGFANPEPGPPERNGLFLLALDPAAFLPAERFRADVDRLTAHVASARPVPGGSPVRIPGEGSLETAAERERLGIPLGDATVELLATILRDLGLPATGM